MTYLNTRYTDAQDTYAAISMRLSYKYLKVSISSCSYFWEYIVLYQPIPI